MGAEVDQEAEVWAAEEAEVGEDEVGEGAIISFDLLHCDIKFLPLVVVNQLIETDFAMYYY